MELTTKKILFLLVSVSALMLYFFNPKTDHELLDNGIIKNYRHKDSVLIIENEDNRLLSNNTDYLSTKNHRLGDSIFFGFRENMNQDEIEYEIESLVKKDLIFIQHLGYRDYKNILFRMYLKDYFLSPEVNFIYKNNDKNLGLKQVKLSFKRRELKKYNLDYSENYSRNKNEVVDIVNFFNRKYDVNHKLNLKKYTNLNWGSKRKYVDFRYTPEFDNIIQGLRRI